MNNTNADKNYRKDNSADFSVEKSGFVLLTDVIPDAVLEIRYYSTFNFVGKRIDSYEVPFLSPIFVKKPCLKKAISQEDRGIVEVRPLTLLSLI